VIQNNSLTISKSLITFFIFWFH